MSSTMKFHSKIEEGGLILRSGPDRCGSHLGCSCILAQDTPPLLLLLQVTCSKLAVLKRCHLLFLACHPCQLSCGESFYVTCYYVAMLCASSCYHKWYFVPHHDDVLSSWWFRSPMRSSLTSTSFCCLNALQPFTAPS